jgi:hypothetical protein
MPDITMCRGTDCPLKEQCYRAQARPDTYQSYFAKPPYKDGNCDYFWVMKPKKQKTS